MIKSMGHFTAIGMRTPAPPNMRDFNTCSDNDTALSGDEANWSWCNPTNRAIEHHYAGVAAVSVETLWQGTKVFVSGGAPDPKTLAGDWRRGKAKRPLGAWQGAGLPLIMDPGEARRRIYLPAFARLIDHWMRNDSVRDRVERAQRSELPVFLRDWDTGRGIDRNGPMSHAWVLACWLNLPGAWNMERALASMAPAAPAQRTLFGGSS